MSLKVYSVYGDTPQQLADNMNKINATKNVMASQTHYSERTGWVAFMFVKE